MTADVDNDDKRPASRRVADDLLTRIESGEFAPGDSLPTYRQLAADYDVAVNTALAAVRLLRDSGTVTIKPHTAAQVRDQSDGIEVVSEINAARSDLNDLQELVRRVGSDLLKLEARLRTLAERVDEVP